MSAEAQAIEAILQRRFARAALYLPSGRLSLYLVFQEWLRPGDRLLMSPVNCDAVFFAALAAGLVPVFAPIDPSTGNIDPAAIDDSTWASLHGVMTTNLYGIAERMDLLQLRCRRHRLLLVEDACHAFDTRFEGRRIGQFGDVAVHSLAKHVGGVGAVVTFADESRRESVARRAAREIQYPSAYRAIRARIAPLLGGGGGPLTRARERLGRLRERLVSRTRRTGHRVLYEISELTRARNEGGGLEVFHRWLQVDGPNYRTWPFPRSLRTTLERLKSIEENSRLRLAGTAKLLNLGYTPAGLRVHPDTVLLRVPLFIQDRENVIARFAKRGLNIDYIFDPPLDSLYAPALAEALPSAPAARIWSRDVLPVDPLCAERFAALLSELREPCLPSREVTPRVASTQRCL